MRSFIILLSAIVGVAVSERNCTEPGIILSSDPHKFLVCVEKDGKLQTIENKCSKGLVFDIRRKRCTKIPIATAFLSLGNGDPAPLSADPAPAPAPKNPPVPLPCKSPGAMCDTCGTMSICVGNQVPGDGSQFVTKKILSLSCEADSVCVTKKGCIKINDGGICLQGKFVCGDLGLYPDPYDCTKYHDCTVGQNGGLDDNEKQCTGGSFGNRWSPDNLSCGWSEDVEACRGYPVPGCQNELQMGSVGGQIYYLCVKDNENHSLSPIMFKCEGSQVFNSTIMSCSQNVPQ